MRRTKILATLGPASDTEKAIEALIKAGVNGFRINFSHGTYESHTEVVKRVKKVREKLDMPIPLLLDTKGPEIRIKTFACDQIHLNKGDKFTLTTREVEGDQNQVSVTYLDFPKDLKKGDRVLLDDGLIELHVQQLTATDIECVVQNGGELGSRKGINVPEVYVNLPSLTEKDVEDIKFGIDSGFDYIAASFVRSAKDVFAIRQVLEENGGDNIEIIAKIESRDGVNNIGEILEISNGIMVARGDLGVEIPPEEVPIVQKELIYKANKAGKPVITATQMLESMVSNPRPTRAEANDVANAIFDGSDTIMLSGETAAGDYPVEAVEMMGKIAETAENAINVAVSQQGRAVPKHTTITNAISYSACTTAADLDATCITTVTQSGFTARMLSKFRPRCPIIACTAWPSVWRKMNLVWGCVPMLLKQDAVKSGDDHVFELAVKEAVRSGVAKHGDTIIISAGLPIGTSGATNTLRVEIVGDVLVKGRGIGTQAVSAKSCVIKALPEAEKYFSKGDILVTSTTSAELMPYIKKAAGLIVGTPGTNDYSHAEIAASALDIPVIICNERIVEMIPGGLLITLDPTNGFVYNGVPGEAKKGAKKSK